MIESLFLTAAELHRLTGKHRFKAQREVLEAMGIRFVPAATGEPLVRADDLDGGERRERNRGPRWDRISQ